MFALVSGRRPRLDLATEEYFEIADDASSAYPQKLAAYRELADRYFDTERYEDFCATSLGHLDEIMLDRVVSAEFDQLLDQTGRSVYPAHEHEQFIAHLRGLLGTRPAASMQPDPIAAGQLPGARGNLEQMRHCADEFSPPAGQWRERLRRRPVRYAAEARPDGSGDSSHQDHG
jgi:hypothetical protein